METNSEKCVTIELLNAIGDAFNKNDADLVMTFFSEDCIFDHGSGPDIFGTRFEGKETVRSVFQGLFDSVEFVNWKTEQLTISGNKAYCEFYRTARLKSGEDQEFLSFDILTFKDGLILHKDTYFKSRTK
jgi:ketosteroid isomerase-like protein|tara:strand:- start:1922 stop:2311 length:390 start_codon:yes stop_codon:yes gene_type:complete